MVNTMGTQTEEPRTEEAIRRRIKEIVLDLAPNPDAGSADGTRLVEDLEYHSLALLELAFALEDEFDMPPIEEEEAQGIQTVKDIEDYVVRKLAEESSTG
jgi:acyl carrier protein